MFVCQSSRKHWSATLRRQNAFRQQTETCNWTSDAIHTGVIWCCCVYVRVFVCVSDMYFVADGACVIGFRCALFPAEPTLTTHNLHCVSDLTSPALRRSPICTWEMSAWDLKVNFFSPLHWFSTLLFLLLHLQTCQCKSNIFNSLGFAHLARIYTCSYSFSRFPPIVYIFKMFPFNQSMWLRLQGLRFAKTLNASRLEIYMQIISFTSCISLYNPDISTWYDSCVAL